MPWLRLLIQIAALCGAGYGLWWAWKNDYISWESIKQSLQVEGLKEMVITIFSRPLFIFLYLIFVLFPVWVITDWWEFFPIPMWQKIILSIGGIWAVNQIMINRNLE